MKAFILISALVGALIVTDANAQVEVTVPETGSVKTTAKVENGILGVTNSFMPPKPESGYAWIRTAISIVQEENRLADAEPARCHPGAELANRRMSYRLGRLLRSRTALNPCDAASRASSISAAAIHLKDMLSRLTSSACRSTPVF